MTPDQMRITVAEALGTTGQWYCPRCRETVGKTDIKIVGRNVYHHRCDAQLHRDSPDYCNSLDAMAEALKTLHSDTRIEYVFRLRQIVERDKPEPDQDLRPWHLYTATALQQAEAFLRALGLIRVTL